MLRLEYALSAPSISRTWAFHSDLAFIVTHLALVGLFGGGVLGGGVLYVPPPLPPCPPLPPVPVANRALVPTPINPSPAPATAPPTAPTGPSAAPALAPPIPPLATLETAIAPAKKLPTAEDEGRHHRNQEDTDGINEWQIRPFRCHPIAKLLALWND